MRGFAVDTERFEFAVREDEKRAAGSFIRAARFDADEAIFDEIDSADAVRGGDFV